MNVVICSFKLGVLLIDGTDRTDKLSIFFLPDSWGLSVFDGSIKSISEHILSRKVSVVNPIDVC